MMQLGGHGFWQCPKFLAKKHLLTGSGDDPIIMRGVATVMGVGVISVHSTLVKGCLGVCPSKSASSEIESGAKYHNYNSLSLARLSKRTRETIVACCQSS